MSLKRFMKTTALCALCALVVFSTAGCGSKAGGAGTTPAGSQTASAQPLPLPIMVTSYYNYEYDDDLQFTTLSSTAETAHLGDSVAADYPKLNKAMEKTATDSINQTKAWEHESLSQMDEDILANMQEYDGYYTLEKTIAARRADTRVVSMMETSYCFELGAHGYTGYDTVNYDSQTGEILDISDVITDTETFKQMIIDKLNYYYADEMEYFIDVPEYVDAVVDGTDQYDKLYWSMGYDGIIVIFNTYTLGAYASGSQTVDFSYEELEGVMDSYYAQIPYNYAFDFNPDDGLTYDINGDGIREHMYIIGEGTEDYSYDSVTLYTYPIDNPDDTSELYLEGYCYDYSASFVHANDQNYMYLYKNYDDGYGGITVIDLSGFEPVYVEEVYLGRNSRYNEITELGERDILTDPDNMQLAIYSDCLGTASISGTYYAGDDGVPLPVVAYYNFDTTSEYNTLTLKVPLNVEVASDDLDADGGYLDQPGVGEMITLSPGETVIKSRTDGENWVDLISEGGNMVRVYVDCSDWPQTIDGVDIEEIFDNIMFAG